MKLCIPIDENRGLNSSIYLHFSTAPKFMIIDTQTMVYEVFDNPDITVGASQKCLSQILSDHNVSGAAVEVSAAVGEAPARAVVDHTPDSLF